MDASVPLLVFLVLVMYLGIVSSMRREDAYMDFLADRLTSRSGNDRLNVWHSDCFSRCGYQLERTLQLACGYDPYRLQRRGRRNAKVEKKVQEGDESSTSSPTSKNNPVTDSNVFYTKRLASSFLRRGSSKTAALKRKKRGIVEECCFNVCAWEEYGEFCHGHMRTRHRRTSHCL